MQRERHKGLHVAIIMDGNGRGVMRRGLPRVAGHRAGVGSLRRAVERALDLGIARLTLYAFSSDNWSRPASEVQSIFWLLRAFLRLETERLRNREVRLQVIGRRDRLAKSVVREIDRAESLTGAGRNLHWCVAIDYASREAITRAATEVTTALSKEAQRSPDVLWRGLSQSLASEHGEVDLLIRTGGEKRLSDFLLSESAYAELLFTDRMWPEFGETDLDLALEDFDRRERRFGGVSAISLQPTTSTA